MKIITAIILFFLLQATVITAAVYLSDGDFSYGMNHLRAQMVRVHEHLLELKEHLINFKNLNGRYPTNDEGLSMLDGLKTELKEFGYGYDSYQGERGEMTYFGSEMLSPWYVPYIYENRRGTDENLFRESPVNSDYDENYSVCVDGGVFVYSSGAIESFNIYTKYKARLYKGCIVFAFGYIVLFFLFASALSNKFYGIIIALGVSAAVYWFGWNYTRVTSYPTGLFSTYEHQARTEAYLELLGRYRNAGILNSETYTKRLKAIEALAAKVNKK